jgi:parvulin-like peptidyl-prolyl isomerase
MEDARHGSFPVYSLDRLLVPTARRSLPPAMRCLLRPLPSWFGPLLGLVLVGCTSLTSPPEAEQEPKLVPAPAATPATPAPAPTPAPTLVPAAAPAESRASASHILVAYKGARGGDKATRTKEQAKARAEEALKKAKAGSDFAALARTYSDDPGSAAKGGELGTFPRAAMVKPFADATFALKPGELSGLVETDFGYHIIKRTQ